MAPAYSTIPTLTDGVVTLRAPISSDVMGSFEQCQDPLTQRWTTIPVPYTLDDANIYMYHFIPRGWETGQEWGFVVEAEDDAGARRFCGTISLRNRGEGRAELAYGAHPWARGTRTDGARAEAADRVGLRRAAPEHGRVAGPARQLGLVADRVAARVQLRGRPARVAVATRRAAPTPGSARCDATTPLLPRFPWLESPTLVGPSVTLRRLEERDLPQDRGDAARTGTPSTGCRTCARPPRTRWSADREYVVERLEEAASGRAVHWAVTDQRTDMYVGQVSLFDLAVPARGGASATGRTRTGDGRGWATEAGRLRGQARLHPVEDGGLGLRRLTADRLRDQRGARCACSNAPGFLRIGRTRRSTLRGDDKWMDTRIYDQLIEDRDRSLR